MASAATENGAGAELLKGILALSCTKPEHGPKFEGRAPATKVVQTFAGQSWFSTKEILPINHHLWQFTCRVYGQRRQYNWIVAIKPQHI